MKDNLGCDYFLLAHVDVEKVHFKKINEADIEFINHIDAWNKMAFKFRGSGRSNTRYTRKDLESFVYGFRLITK